MKLDPILETQMLAGTQKIGLYKGICVDNRDPFGLGRIRIWSYALHGDFQKIPIEALPWSEPMVPLSGSFTPPPMWSRVWFGFDAGDKYSPVYIGFWYGIPNKSGKLPFDKTGGTEVPAEAWSFHDLSPESILVARSGEGNAIWMAQQFVGGNNLASSINLMDTGGKQVRIFSLHNDAGNFEDEFVSIDSGKTLDQIANENGDPNPTRDGTEVSEQTTGMIEIEHQNVKRSLISDADSFTVDRMLQYDGDSNLKIESEAMNGEILTNRADQVISAMVSGTMFMSAPTNVFINNLMTPPRRYD